MYIDSTDLKRKKEKKKDNEDIDHIEEETFRRLTSTKTKDRRLITMNIDQ
jgi:hypothetical protein